MGIKIVFLGKNQKHEEFLITPALAYGSAPFENSRAWAIGLKWGYYAAYIALFKKPNQK